MLGVFDAVLVRKLPVQDQDGVVVLWTWRDPKVELPVDQSLVQEFGPRSQTMSAVASFAHWGATPMPLVNGDQTLALRRAMVSPNFFDVLGTRPFAGRFFRAEDARTGAPRVMVLSFGTWRRMFGGDTTAIGRQLIEPYSQSPYTIVGIAPAGLDYPVGTETWVAVEVGAWPAVDVIARLAPGATPAMAQAEFFAAVLASNPWSKPFGATVTILPDAVFGQIKAPLVAIVAAVALLLLIACVNVANLLLLRAARRSREMGIRRAVGATSTDILRMLLAESLVLAAAAGALGLLIAEISLRVLAALAPAGFPRIDDIRAIGLPVGLTFVTTLGALVLFGIGPAVRTARADLTSPLRHDGRSGMGTRSQHRVRRGLVVAQVAIALILLAGAGLLMRSLGRLNGLDLGYRADRLAMVNLSMPIARYQAETARFTLGSSLAEGLERVPGVTSVTPILVPPFLGANVFQGEFEPEDNPGTTSNPAPMIPFEIGGPDFFRTFDIPLARGRGFTEADREGAPRVVVVSEGVARRFWPGEDPIGKRIRMTGFDTTAGDGRTVVGVTSDTRFRTLRDPTWTVYLPWRQAPWWQGMLAVRTSASLETLLPPMRQALRAVDPDVTIWQANAMDELVTGQLTEPRASAFLLSCFGVVALLLSAIGLYGVMAAAVRERTHEIGVRMALGAAPTRVQRAIVVETLVMFALGTGLGLAGALLASRLLVSMLYDVSPFDPVSLIGASALMLVVALLAVYLPARRATEVNPADVLRSA